MTREEGQEEEDFFDDGEENLYVNNHLLTLINLKESTEKMRMKKMRIKK